MSAPTEPQNADESSAFFANNDASSYNARYLKSIRNKARFQELHFYQCPVELIDELFPKQSQKGTLDPPAPYKVSATTLSQWRELTQEEQLNVLQNKDKQFTKEGGDASAGELKRGLEVQGEQPNIDAAPAQKVLKTDEDPNAIPTRWDIFSQDLNVDFFKDRLCCGITLDLLKETYPSESAKLQGFACLVGDAMQSKAQAYKDGHSWPFASDPRVLGALVEQAPSGNGTTTVLPKWICVQGGDGVDATNSTKIESVHFHHPTCDRASTAMLCENCKVNGVELVNLCGASLS